MYIIVVSIIKFGLGPACFWMSLLGVILLMFDIFFVLVDVMVCGVAGIVESVLVDVMVCGVAGIVESVLVDVFKLFFFLTLSVLTN